MPKHNGSVSSMLIFEEMNFLAHYFFDHRQSALYNVGLIYPDLYRNFVIGGRVSQSALEDIRLLTPLLLGCKQHYKSDDLFHHAPPFKRGEEAIKELLRASVSPGFSRDYFIAHIFYELILDHYLLQKEPDLAAQFYADFERADLKEIRRFSAYFGEQETDRFMKGFNQFVTSAYLEKYAKAESVVYALGRICNKMNLSPFNEHQKVYLIEVLKQVVVIIAEDFIELQSCLQKD